MWLLVNTKYVRTSWAEGASTLVFAYSNVTTVLILRVCSAGISPVFFCNFSKNNENPEGREMESGSGLWILFCCAKSVFGARGEGRDPDRVQKTEKERRNKGGGECKNGKMKEKEEKPKERKNQKTDGWTSGTHVNMLKEKVEKSHTQKKKTNMKMKMKSQKSRMEQNEKWKRLERLEKSEHDRRCFVMCFGPDMFLWRGLL